jgi:hypothetical protein
VDQGIGRGMTIEGHAPAEVIPAPEPTPADAQTAPLPVPMPDAGPAPKSPPAGELGPVTGGPAMPALNAPIVHATASVRSDRPLDNPLRNGSNSAGMLGMDSLRPGMPAQAVSSTNRLRSAGSENAMPVQPAGYTAQIHDGADSGR